MKQLFKKAKKSIKKPKYIKIILLITFFIFSIKPLIFTWNFILANYHLKIDESNAGHYMIQAASYNRSVSKIFTQYHPFLMEEHLVYNAISMRDKNYLSKYARIIPLSRIKKLYHDNFYVQSFLFRHNKMQNIGRDWANLDSLSFKLVKNPNFNQVTLNILKKIQSNLDEDFFNNIADFAKWQGNPPLSKSIKSNFLNKHEVIKTIPMFNGLQYQNSISQTKDFLWNQYKLHRQFIGKNLLQCPDFSTNDCIGRHWYFSKMANKKVFSKGSFFMGEDYSEKNKNLFIRIMGFFNSQDKDKAKPRAGVRYRHWIPAKNGFYILCFDYYTETSHELASFCLNQTREKRLPHTQRKWKKVIFIINNAFNHYKKFNPLIRMWGTGSLLVDNVFLAKISTLKFSITESHKMHIKDIQQKSNN